MSISTLESFIKKYQTAKNHNSKEIRFTIQESEELALALASVLSNVNSLALKVIDLQNQLLEDNSTIDLSGGAFS